MNPLLKERSEFIVYLYDLLSEFEYLFLSQANPQRVKIQPELALNVLIKRSNMEALLNGIKSHQSVRNIKVSSRFSNSATIITLKNDLEVLIDFQHKFIYKSVVFMDEQEMLERRIKRNDLYFLNVENAFEYKILNGFLNKEGVSDEDYLFFNELHFLIQEDLLESFNAKYNTNFRSLISLTSFTSRQKNNMLKSLENMPVNKFVKKVNVRWHNFVGNLKQARII